MTVDAVHGGPRGYPELATFLDSDDNLMLYRRFGYLQSRILLEKQERLRLLEEELDELDHYQTSTPGDENALITLDLESSKRTPRSELMTKIEPAWTEYGQKFLPLKLNVLTSNSWSPEAGSRPGCHEQA